MPTSFSTTWTGGGPDSLWTDAANWNNGVPLPGGPFPASGTDVVVIDNSIEITPFTVTIAGSEATGGLTLDATNPVGAPVVRLTGTLNMAFASFAGGSFFGGLTLKLGTFEIDGGDLQVAGVQQSGGTISFGNFATYGASTLDAGIIGGNLTIGNDSVVVVAQYRGGSIIRYSVSVPISGSPAG